MNKISRMFGRRVLRSDFDSPYGEKGQKRSARPKASGAAQLKRAATKRNNIRKHK